MKNIFFISIIIFCVSVSQCIAQSKKEQIKHLTNKIDSLASVTNLQKRNIDSLMLQEEKHMLNIQELEESNVVKDLKNLELQSTNKKKELELAKNNQISTLEINNLKDSLARKSSFKTELNVFFLSDFAQSSIGSTVLAFDFDFLTDESSADQNLTGKFISYWPKSWTENYSNNYKKLEYANGQYKNGLKNGYWKYKLCDGTIQCEGSYLNGLKNQKWVNYDFCHETFNFTKSKEEYGYLSLLYTIIDYYDLVGASEWDFSKEEIFYQNGIPSDTLYYKNNKNELKLKISWKNGLIYYENNQPLTNQKVRYEYPFFRGLENNELIIYNRNGSVKFKLSVSNNQKTERYFSNNGVLIKKCDYIDQIGKCEIYNVKGTITDNFAIDLGAGKFGPECTCQ